MTAVDDEDGIQWRRQHLAAMAGGGYG